MKEYKTPKITAKQQIIFEELATEILKEIDKCKKHFYKSNLNVIDYYQILLAGIIPTLVKSFISDDVESELQFQIIHDFMIELVEKVLLVWAIANRDNEPVVH